MKDKDEFAIRTKNKIPSSTVVTFHGGEVFVVKDCIWLDAERQYETTLAPMKSTPTLKWYQKLWRWIKSIFKKKA